MSRGLASAITTELAKGQYIMAHLVSLELADSWLFTDAPYDVLDPDTQIFIFYFSLTSGSTAATVSTRSWYGSGVVDQLHSQLASGMTVQSLTGDLQAGTTIASIGASPNVTLSHTANTTDSQHSTIVRGGFLYKTGGFLLGLDSIQENTGISIGAITLGISSVNQAIISDVLNNGHLNREVKIKRIFLDSNLDVISGAVFSIYSGRIDGMTISDSGGESSIELSVANHWSDFARTNGRHTNNASQQQHYDGDMSMEFAPQAGKKMRWGHIEEDPERW